MISFTLDITWILIFIIWLVALQCSMLIVTERISLLGIYHPVYSDSAKKRDIVNCFFKDLTKNIKYVLHISRNTECNKVPNKYAESFYTKFMIVLKINFVLSIILLITYVIVISSALALEPSIDYHLFCFAAVLTLVTLITIRLLANQSNFLLYNTVKMPAGKTKEEIATDRNNDTISHFNTFICTAMMLLLIIASSGLISPKYTHSLDIPKYELLSYGCVVGYYLIVLPISTFFVELFFLFSPPINKTPHEQDFYLKKGSL